MRGGAMANAQLTNYLVPTTLDTPPIDVALIEKPYAHGPYGAKGLGEMPFDGVAPAVVNAIRSLGIDIREVPATPERVMAAPRLRDSGLGARDSGLGARGLGLGGRGFERDGGRGFSLDEQAKGGRREARGAARRKRR